MGTANAAGRVFETIVTTITIRGKYVVDALVNSREIPPLDLFHGAVIESISVNEGNQLAGGPAVLPLSISELLREHFLLYPDSHEYQRNEE